MANFDLTRQLATSHGGKIVLLVMDGLGGLPMTQDGLTELEAAHTPNLDRLAREGSVGLSIPVTRGIAPGSGPAHLALFGYDPVQYEIGRGVLEATGIGLSVEPGDVAVRGNFCTVDENGLITDRRAGRIPTEEGAKRVELLRQITVPGVTIDIEIAKEYRFAMVLRGDGLNDAIADTDPQATGVAPLPAQAQNPGAQHTADIVNQWLAQAREVLRGQEPANMVTLRGFAMEPGLPKYADVYKLKAACVAVYPMYKGVSKLVGMDVIRHQPTPRATSSTTWRASGTITTSCSATSSTPTPGEDGDFDAKVRSSSRWTGAACAAGPHRMCYRHRGPFDACQAALA